MAFLETLDPVTLINLILSITIVVVAVWGYSRLKNITPLYIGAAYVLFSTSHAILLFKVTEVPQSLLIAIRLCGYLLVIFGLYAILKLVMELQQAQERIESRKGGTIAPDCLPCVATNCGFLVIALSLMGLALQAYIFLSSTNMPDFLIITGQPLIPGPIVLALFLLLGICLATLQLWKDEHWPQTLITIIAGIVLILSVLFIISALMGNIQDGKIVLPGGIVGTSAIVIRSFLTVTGLGIAAVILLTLRSPQPPMRDAGAVLSALLFFIGAFTLVGYAYQSPYLYGGSLQPVTPSSAVMFMILGAGLLAYIGTGSRLITRALDNSIQSEMMRGLIPVMVIAVLIEGWICLVALPAIGKVINPAFVSAGVVIISIIAISFVIAIQAGQISAVIMRAEQEREKAEDQKQKSQALFKTMFESSADGILTLDNDRILDCNKTAEVMFGYPRDQINGKSLLTFSPERQPDGQLSSEKVQEIVAAALAGETMFYEWDHLRKNGASFPTEISLNRVKCGKKFYLQASIRDITLRKMDEEELREAYGRITAAEEELRQQYTALAEKEAHLQREEDKFHTMADFTVDWEFWLAPDNTFVYISPSCEEITGFSVAEFMQDPSLMGTIVHKDDLPLFTHHKETIHGTAHHGHDEFRIVRKDGDIRWIAHSCRPVYGKDGTYLGRRATNRDITERKKAEEALRESEGRVRRKLAAILEEEGDIGLLNLSDIIDIPALQALMDDIHRLTGIASAVIETNGTVLIGAGWQDICTQFHRQNPESCRNCIESDTALTTGVGQGEFKLYKCKNNMWDIATPLLVGGKHLGNIFVGQFMLADEIQDREVFRRQAEQYGFDETAYLAAFDRVPRVSRETVSAVMAFYTRFAGLITNLSMSNITLARTGAERERLMTSLQASEEELRHQYTALAEAEEMFRNPVEHSPVGVYLQQDNIIRYANPRFAEMLGYTRDEVLNKPFEELADPDHHSRVCVMGSPQQEGEADSHSRCAEFTGRKKDGTPIELEIFEAPMEYKGHPAFYGTLVDITERKKADAAMRESEEKTRLILDSAAEAIYGVDETGRCVFYNPSCARLTGYTRPGEMLGKNMHMLLHHSHPDGTPMPSAQCRIFLGYLKGEGSHFDDEVFWRADGSSFPVEVWSYPQKKDGNITGMVVTFFDITERKKAEAALLEDEQKLQQQNLELEASNEEVRSIAQTLQDNLDELLKSQKALQESEDKLRLQNMDLEASNEEIRAISETLQNNYNELAKSQKALAENEEKYRSLVDNLSVAVYRNDLESPSRWIWVNPAFCKILGYDSIEEAMSHPVSDIYFSPEDRLPIIHALNKVGSIKNFEVVFKKKNGSPIWVSLSAQVKKNPD
ncbi:MAG TPA: PAS domain S-box protein, partial [Methanoregula sp.]|nr:PAS domain S-box protein [Methanoregula sp.]